MRRPIRPPLRKVVALALLLTGPSTGVNIDLPATPEIVTVEDAGMVGLFTDAHPAKVFVASHVSDAQRPYVTAHETAHFYQHKYGVAMDECAADAYAYAMTGDFVSFTSTIYSEGCDHV